MKNLLAQTISVLLIPLLIPSYLVGIVLYYVPQDFISYLFFDKILFLLETIIFSAIIPLLSVYFLYKKNIISSLDLIKREDRKYPQLIALLSYIILYLIYTLQIGFTHLLSLLILANIISLFLIFIISAYWKISTHTSGAIGFITILSLLILKKPDFGYFILFFFIAILSISVFFARLYLKAHTIKQVIGGALLGLISTLWLFLFM